MTPSLAPLQFAGGLVIMALNLAPFTMFALVIILKALTKGE